MTEELQKDTHAYNQSHDIVRVIAGKQASIKTKQRLHNDFKGHFDVWWWIVNKEYNHVIS